MAIVRRESRDPLTGSSNVGGVGRNRDSEPISGLTACVKAATGQVLYTRSPVDHGHRLASYDTSLVVSGGVIAREDDEMFVTRSFNVTPKTTEQRI